jgi:hypothetical protein
MRAFGLGVVGLIALAATTLVGCGGAGSTGAQVSESPSRTVLSTLPPATLRPTEAVSTPGPVALPTELVGSWMQENWGGPNRSGYFSRKAYAFGADGTYELVDLLCFTGASCEDANPPETGIATVTGDQLSLSPRTPSVEGQRSYRFAVVRDPNMGDLRLQFQMPGYIDEFFWQP